MHTTPNGVFRDIDVAVIIPSYKVKSTILDVVNAIPDGVKWIVVVDDCCPEHSGAHVASHSTDERLVYIYHKHNTGVGGAMIDGYKKALSLRADICIKIDGDGQMNPKLIPILIHPIVKNQADYTKGNRFYFFDSLVGMPRYRKILNLLSSFVTKFSSGYWHIFDSNNGFTCIHAKTLHILPLDKISRRFFFETDMLYQLNLINAAVVDIPMKAHYPDGKSNFLLKQELLSFGLGYTIKFFKRAAYKYFIRDFNFGSVQLLFGSIFFIFSLIFGGVNWVESHLEGTDNSPGTVMLFGIFFLTGVQLLLGFINYDINSTPTRAIHPILEGVDQNPAMPVSDN